MPINNIEDLYYDYRNSNEYNADNTILYFERNAIVFNNFKLLENTNELRLYTELTWQFINALYSKGRFNNAVDNSISYLKIINDKINLANSREIKNDWYYGILLLKGMSSYNLQDYKESTSIFGILIY